MESLLGVILKGLLRCLRFCIRTHQFQKIYPLRARNFCSAVSRGIQQRGQPRASCWTIHLSATQVITTNTVPYIHLRALKLMTMDTIQETNHPQRVIHASKEEIPLVNQAMLEFPYHQLSD
uniref:Uncharacterized protein n=1 Tax=Arundo donax TaxID=35708 RepID=A0A0A9D368_ARUDO